MNNVRSSNSITAYTDKGFRSPEYKTLLRGREAVMPSANTAIRVADRLVAGMDLELSEWQRMEVRDFLFKKLLWEWPSDTLRSALPVQSQGLCKRCRHDQATTDGYCDRCAEDIYNDIQAERAYEAMVQR